MYTYIYIYILTYTYIFTHIGPPCLPSWYRKRQSLTLTLLYPPTVHVHHVRRLFALLGSCTFLTLVSWILVRYCIRKIAKGGCRREEMKIGYFTKLGFWNFWNYETAPTQCPPLRTWPRHMCLSVPVCPERGYATEVACLCFTGLGG